MLGEQPWNVYSHIQLATEKNSGALAPISLILQIGLEIIVPVAASDLVVDDDGGPDS